MKNEKKWFLNKEEYECELQNRITVSQNNSLGRKKNDWKKKRIFRGNDELEVGS